MIAYSQLKFLFPMAGAALPRRLRLGRVSAFFISLALLRQAPAADLRIHDERPLDLPVPGAYELRILSPTVLELTLVTTKAPDPAPVETWDFVAAEGQLHLPTPSQFTVRAGAQTIPVQAVGFKRRVRYAPLKQRDLRIGNHVYLQLARPVAEGQRVEVTSPAKLWPDHVRFAAQCDPLRFSPAIHVNQVGYVPAFSKTAMVGYYLGSLGELDIRSPGNLPPAEPRAPTPRPPQAAAGSGLKFKLIDTATGKEVYLGQLTPRPDQGFTFPCYQQVWEADFTEFKTPGEYRLAVPGLGASFPFLIGDGVAAALARTYALGLYHQRCGTANEMPYTRHTHAPCHTAPAEVPTMAFTNAQFLLGQSTADTSNTVRQTAPRLKDTESSLYPFVNHGKVDVSGGHHDAGDYSKYTINSAGLIHMLMVAVDAFPGAADLDNLGLPESGDGKSDLLQEAKWEADFLAKMQDADGGFYFLVYPRNRRYESNVKPDQGDPQVVWPKNTAATAAAVAALAQCASSPRLKAQFPEAAALYLQKAKKGWAFLERAIARYGKDGSYQKLTHYGNEFIHDDELAWAACEMFLATGEPAFQRRLIEWFNPSDPGTRRWSWQRLTGSYGCAIRSYALAVKAGKAKPGQLDVSYLMRCQNELEAAGRDQLRRAQECAYGTSFPSETKRVRSAGWYFSGDAAFDLAAACALDYPLLNDPRPQFRAALMSNLNYEAGCNPVNVMYVTGLGWKRQRDIVHQYAQNDFRVLPPDGIPIGNIQAGFMWLDLYKRELGALSFPSDGDAAAPYPFYDRWGDSFNLSTEFVVLDLGCSLAATAWLLAQTPLKQQAWKPVAAQIDVRNAQAPTEAAPAPARSYTAALKPMPGTEWQHARIVWEAQGQQPAFGPTFTFTPTNTGPQWVEADALLPDGRRFFAATNFTATAR